MAYSAEVVRRARAQLAQAKEDRESENRQHLAEAYAKIPRIREIDLELRRTMGAAAQAACASGSDGREAMEKVRKANMGLQQERARLADAYFPVGYLDDSPVCDRCGGTGYIGTQMCECLKELCRQEQKRELTFLTGGKETFNQFRLDYYPDRLDPKLGFSPRQIMENTLQRCRTYAYSFALNSGNLLFSGGTGLGKTFLSACIARVVADRGYSVVYESAPHLFSKLEAAKFSPTEENRAEAARFGDCDLLIMDDLGTEMPGQFITAALYTLLNDRILANRPMVVSTNLNIDEITRRYSPQISSRLRGGFNLMTFVGEDIRVLKNRGY